MVTARTNAKLAINCDMGESFGLYKIGDDEGMMPHITIANVACGFHASDPTVMARTVRLAKRHNVKVGAHPSLPDLQGFGRREMKMRAEELTDCVVYQVGALKGFLEREGMQLFHVKPHGSLYGMAARSQEVAKAVAEAVKVFHVPVMGMIGTMISQLREAVRGAVERRVVVLPHLDLLTTSQGGLTAEAREVIPLLYENPALVWLGFKDPSFPLPRVIDNL